ncbi:polymorphic toxin-type HINT domain-containing protein [Kutzneria kofuensis]
MAGLGPGQGTDPTTGKSADEAVTDVIIGQGLKHLVDVDITDNGEAGSVSATDNHPFWVVDLNQWVDAGKLKAGEHLLAEDGHSVVVTELHRHDEITRVYNLTVDTLHTYYVFVGTDELLVHNGGGAWCDTKKPIFGNRPDFGQTALYVIVDPTTGKILKWGVSDDPVTRYSNSDFQQWSAQYGGTYQMQLLRNFDSRQDAEAAEKYLYDRVPGPENHEPAKGSLSQPGLSWQSVLDEIQRGKFGGHR